MSETATISTLQIEQKKDYTIVQIDNGKVNGITTQLLADLKTIFLALDADDSTKGIILTGRPHCFSAGINVKAIALSTPEEVNEFWVQYHLALQAMVRFSKPFVCAITGYAPAGATILACTADYRIMGKGEKHRIGMHEFKMSMQIPELLCDIYAYVLGEKQAWEATQKAKLYTSDEALTVGLVNESVEVEEVLARAEKYMKFQVNVYDKVYKTSKRFFRKGLLKVVDRDFDPMLKEIAADNADPKVKMMMQMFIASLKK